MSDETKCRVCGRPLSIFDNDGLCSGTPRPRERATCFMEFLKWAEKALRLSVVAGGGSQVAAVDWSRPEVQVAFDEWAATQSPMEAKP